MSGTQVARAGWPWQVTAALWLYLADVLAVFLTGMKVASANIAQANALDPPSPGGGYLALADSLLSTAFMGLLILAYLLALGLIAIVWSFRGWTRHLMALFSAALVILLLIVGGMPEGSPVYAICFGLITLLAAGLIYTDAAQRWFERPKNLPAGPLLAAGAGVVPVMPAPAMPRGARPAAVRFAVACLAGFLVLIFIGWSSDSVTVTDPGEAFFFHVFDALVVLTLALIPYGLWHGVPVARKIATPFCLVSVLLLSPYSWGPQLLNCAMMVLAVSCIFFLHRHGVREWFDAA